MIIKAEVTPEEKELIQSLAKAEGMSISAYIKCKILCKTENNSDALMQCVEVQAGIAQDINSIATTILKSKAIYESDILELIDRMTALEQANLEMLKAVRNNGNSRKQKHKGNATIGSEVQQQPK